MSLFDAWDFRHIQAGDSTSENQRWLEASQPLSTFPAIDPSLLKVKEELLPFNPDDPMSQLVNAWMSSSFNESHTNDGALFRRQRRFLEKHPALLHPRSDETFYEMMARVSANADTVDALSKHLRVLQQARCSRKRLYCRCCLPWPLRQA